MSENNLPLICLAILAKQKEKMLPSWLSHVENWDYPKSRIALYIKENNSTDNTKKILVDWIERIKNEYHSIYTDFSNFSENIQNFGVHEWNSIRFKILGKIRNDSIKHAIDIKAKFYLVVDVDNFVLPNFIKKLTSYNLPIVAPFLKHASTSNEKSDLYSNYHYTTNKRGYFKEDPRYYQILRQEITGIIKCDVVHCSYIIRDDILPYINYLEDDSNDYEYVIFSRRLRQLNIPQYLDNQEIYGYLTLYENVEAVNSAYKQLLKSNNFI